MTELEVVAPEAGEPTVIVLDGIPPRAVDEVPVILMLPDLVEVGDVAVGVTLELVEVVEAGRGTGTEKIDAILARGRPVMMASQSAPFSG